MGVLSDSLTKRATALQTQRARMVENHARELAQIETEIAALQAAARSLSAELEATYEQLVAMGLIQPVTR